MPRVVQHVSMLTALSLSCWCPHRVGKLDPVRSQVMGIKRPCTM